MVTQHALIVCLGVALLFGQTFRLHMHIQHDGVPSSTSTGYIVEVHMAFPLHDTMYDTLHQDNYQDHHHSASIDVSSSSFVNKAKLLSPFVLLFCMVSIILCIPQLCYFRRKYDPETERHPGHYLFHPPLRAPPM